MNLSEAKQRKNRKINAYYEVFNSPNGKVVLEDLEQTFASTLKKCNGVVDPHATIAAVGSRAVIDHINLMRNQHELD